MSKKSEYSEKLRDPRWQKLRLQVFERDGWRCLSCGDSTKTLAVHHKRYERGLEPWEYPLDSLMTLCEPCHQEEYEWRAEVERQLTDALKDKGFLCREVQSLTAAFADMELVAPLGVIVDTIGVVLFNSDVLRQLVKDREAIRAGCAASREGPKE